MDGSQARRLFNPVSSRLLVVVVAGFSFFLFLSFIPPPLLLSSPLQPRSSLSPSPSDLPSKLRAAFEVFFPPAPRDGELNDARGEAKRRLRMVLVADRSAMTEDTLQRMKDSIVEAVSSYVEIDGGAPQVQVQWNQDPELGTIYSVSVPVVRVLSQVSRVEKLGKKNRWWLEFKISIDQLYRGPIHH